MKKYLLWILAGLIVTGIWIICPAIAEEAGSSPGDSGSDEQLLEFLDDEEPGNETVQVADPLYYWNKGMYHFNDKLYFWVMKPVATGYKAVTPNIVRTGVKNFFRNLGTPLRMVNCLLQGKSEQAGVELGRFMVNTTVGVLGFGNPADNQPDLQMPPDEDFGQTLGLYGIGNGCYIVWPLFGPSTLRDSVGMAGGYFMDPVSYVDPVAASAGISGLDKVNNLSFQLGDYETLKSASLEPYEAFRNAYLQYRKRKISE